MSTEAVGKHEGMGVGAPLETGLASTRKVSGKAWKGIYLHTACFGSLGRFEAVFQAQKNLKYFLFNIRQKAGASGTKSLTKSLTKVMV
jgi:hypothetical protein